MDYSIRETRHEYFVRRLREMGMYDADSDYAGQIGVAIEELSKTFEDQGHSGMSAAITITVFEKLFNEWDTDSAFNEHKRKEKTNDHK